MGHKLGPPDSAAMGGFQAIAVQAPNDKSRRVYRAGSDHRKDGQAVASGCCGSA